MGLGSGGIHFYGGGGAQHDWFDPNRGYGQGPGFFNRGPCKWLAVLAVVALLALVSICSYGVT